MKFAEATIGHTHVGIACTLASSTRPCSCLVNNQNKSLRPCLLFLQIARPNIANKPSFQLVLSGPYHKRHMTSYVCDRLMPCFSCNLYTQPCLLDLGIAQECTPRNTGCRPRFGNNQLGNLCTFQSRVHFETFRHCIFDSLSQGHHESFYNRRGIFHTMKYWVGW